MPRLVFLSHRERLPNTFPPTGVLWQPGPATQAATPWTVTTPVHGMLNIAGLVDPDTTGRTWLQVGGLTIAQESLGVRITLGTESLLVGGFPDAWMVLSLLDTGDGVQVVADEFDRGTLPGVLDEAGPITIGADAILAPGTYPHDIPFTDPTPWTTAFAAFKHRSWRHVLRGLDLHTDTRGMSLDLGPTVGPFYNALW